MVTGLVLVPLSNGNITLRVGEVVIRHGATWLVCSNIDINLDHEMGKWLRIPKKYTASENLDGADLINLAFHSK